MDKKELYLQKLKEYMQQTDLHPAVEDPRTEKFMDELDALWWAMTLEERSDINGLKVWRKSEINGQ